MPEILVQHRRDTRTATRFIAELIAQLSHPTFLITDKLCS